MNILKTSMNQHYVYVGNNGNETKFFQLLNIFCWKNHPVKQPEFLKSMYEKGAE
jgi:hypothetical protein